MLIGSPKEIKNHEYRVGMTPPAVREEIGYDCDKIGHDGRM